MGCLGLHFALDQEQVAALRAVKADRRVEFVQDEFETAFWSSDPSRVQQTDKAWDAIHRSLTDGTLDWRATEYPLSHAFLGGEPLHRQDGYILSLKTPEQVVDVASALRPIDVVAFRAGYDHIEQDRYGAQLGDLDFSYTWEWFQELVEFFGRAASAGHSVLFTASQ